jgi:hypothetical protein
MGIQTNTHTQPHTHTHTQHTHTHTHIHVFDVSFLVLGGINVRLGQVSLI